MTATEAIKQRQKEMQGVYGSMKTFAAIAKKEQPFDAEVVQDAAKMAEHLAKAEELFPEGSAEGEVETWANRRSGRTRKTSTGSSRAHTRRRSTCSP